MYALAKRGFNQSYSYFTWRNTKSELDVFPRTLDAARERFLPAKLFVNTPTSSTPPCKRGDHQHSRCAHPPARSALHGHVQRLRVAEQAGVRWHRGVTATPRSTVTPPRMGGAPNIKPLIRTLNRLRRRHARCNTCTDPGSCQRERAIVASRSHRRTPPTARGRREPRRQRDAGRLGRPPVKQMGCRQPALPCAPTCSTTCASSGTASGIACTSNPR